MLAKKSANRKWIPSEYPGIERSLLRIMKPADVRRLYVWPKDRIVPVMHTTVRKRLWFLRAR